MEAISSTWEMVAIHVRCGEEGGGERKIGGAPAFAVVVVGGEGDEGKRDIAMFAEADGGDRTFLGVPEEPEKLVHAVPFPSAVRDVFEAFLFHGGGGLSCVREEQRIGDGEMVEAVVEWQSHAANAGKQLEPWEEEPDEDASGTGDHAVRQEKYQAETGDEEDEDAEFAKIGGACAAQGQCEHDQADDHQGFTHGGGKARDSDQTSGTDSTIFLLSQVLVSMDSIPCEAWHGGAHDE